MRQSSQPAIAFVLCCLFSASSAAQITEQRARDALNRGVQYLIKQQRADGSWTDDYPSYPTGVTSLCTLALLSAGRGPETPEVSKALAYLRKQPMLEDTYTVALQTQVLCAAEPKKDLFRIRQNVGWLVKAQRTGNAGENAGGWGYRLDGPGGSRDADQSNSQFALLALHEAERVGIDVDDSVWRLALGYWQRGQKADGSFAYRTNPSSGSMTCAGVGSLIIASGQVGKLDADVTPQGVQCCLGNQEEDDAIERGLTWLGRNFSVDRNPSVTPLEGNPRLYYYLYALERIGRLAGRRFVGDHDWYREGAESLVNRQDKVEYFWSADDRLVGTAFAVLFLSKGKRPILMGKLKRQPSDDWNRHGQDVSHLTQYVEKQWKQDLTWQVIDWEAATEQDLWGSPVLFLTGRDALRISPTQKETLKSYVERGGFLFAENCCGGEGFDRDFRALMEELFPDSPLRLLPPDHPIWFAQQRIDPQFLEGRPLLGIDACCRTGVVYCPGNLSCYWELAVPQRSRSQDLPTDVQAEIDACLAIGTNVVTYATGRELKQKLDEVNLVSVVKSTATRERGALYIAKLQHGGGSDDAPSALSHLLSLVGQQTHLPVATDKRLLSLLDPNLPDYPIAFLHGRRAFRWSQAERKAFKRFVENGGFVLADAICANEEFAESFRREVRGIFPELALQRVPPDHPMFSQEFFGHDVRTVSLRDPRARSRRDDPLVPRKEQIQPLLEGIEIDGRYVVILSPYDMSCALENRPSLECRGYTPEDAAKLATNIILYAMQQ